MSVCSRKCLLHQISSKADPAKQRYNLSKLFYANPAYFPKILNRSLKKTNTISAMKNIRPIM